MYYAYVGHLQMAHVTPQVISDGAGGDTSSSYRRLRRELAAKSGARK